MKTKALFNFSRLIWAIVFFILIQGCISLPVSPPGTRPIITHAFIPKERGRYGDVLKIYIEAEDPKGYMFRIFTVVDQVGYGLYFPDTIYVKRNDDHYLLGYLQWNTFSSNAGWLPEWTRIAIRVSVADTDGNESDTVVFPFEFVSEVVPEAPLPTPFDQGDIPRLGYININLYNPFETGREGPRILEHPHFR